MRSIPFGYEVVGGKVQINNEEAKKLKQICENYLSGMAFVASETAVGLTMKHGTVKQLVFTLNMK